MGSSSSKSVRATGAAARKYPTRTPTQPSPVSRPAPAPTNATTGPTSASLGPSTSVSENRPGPTVHTRAQPSETRTDAINLDARDPDLASRLNELGPVKPFPTFSNSSTSSPATYGSTNQSPFGKGIFPTPGSNPAIAILTARARIQEEVEQEKVNVGRRGFEGRQYLDIANIRKVLALRDEQGMTPEDIERALKLKKGTVQSLGRVGVVEAA